ncbi:MAG: peptidase MA family metallohydrolase [Chloroflexota bacterium]
MHKGNSARIWATRVVSILFGLTILFGSAQPVSGQGGGEVAEARAEHRFGEEVRFFARIQSPIPIQNASVTFRAADGIAQTQPMSVNADGTANYRYDARLNLLPPFARIVYWFDVTLSDGTRFTSGQFEFIYSDNRFAWQSLEDGGLRVHWYEGDAAFGAAVLDAARRGAEAARALVPMEFTGTVDVYVYANTTDLQSALDLGGQVWVEGHASPELGVVMLSVTPGPEQSNTLERQTPHELTHVLMYQSLGAGYKRLPVWLTEGMAKNAELVPNPDMDAVLAAAVDSNSLLPLSELCAAFPPDTGRAFLAYAESKSFVRFLLDNYGTTGLSALISAYADGMDCEEGARRALEQPLSQLEVRWRETTLGENRSGVVAMNLFPYLLVLGLVLFVPVWGAINRLIERRRNARRNQ